jgi:serine/threonine protein kinase
MSQIVELRGESSLRHYDITAVCLLSNRMMHGWKIGKYIGSGGFGDVYEVCKDQCDRVIKIVQFDENFTQEAFQQEIETLLVINAFEHEQSMKHKGVFTSGTRTKPRCPLAPRVYGHWICQGVPVHFHQPIYTEATIKKTVGFILLERWDMTLGSAMDQGYYPTDYQINKLVKKLTLLNIDTAIHNLDLKPNNFLVKIIDRQIADITVGDWGFIEKEMVTPEELRQTISSVIFGHRPLPRRTFQRPIGPPPTFPPPAFPRYSHPVPLQAPPPFPQHTPPPFPRHAPPAFPPTVFHLAPPKVPPPSPPPH